MPAVIIPKFDTDLLCEDCFVDIIFQGTSNPDIQFKLASSRVTFGFVVICNKFCHVHYKYLDTNSKPRLIVDIYGLDSSGNFIREHRHTLVCGYSCGNVNGKVMQINTTSCRIILGDLTNYTLVKVIEFTIDSIVELYEFDWSQIDYNIEEVYYLNKNLILNSDVIGFDTNCIGIRVTNLSDHSILGKEIIFKSNSTHKYTNKPNELESSIIQVIENKYVLIKIKLINSINILKVVEEYILVLVDVIEGQVESIQKFDSKLEYAYTIEFTSNSNSDLNPQIGFLKIT